MNIKGKTYSEIYILWVLELKQKLQAMHVKHLLNLQTVFLSGCFSLSRGTKSQNTGWYLIGLAFRHADVCRTLLYNTIEENMRGMKE